MFALQNTQNLFVAVISISISAVLFATAIIPASPGLLA